MLVDNLSYVKSGCKTIVVKSCMGVTKLICIEKGPNKAKQNFHPIAWSYKTEAKSSLFENSVDKGVVYTCKPTCKATCKPYKYCTKSKFTKYKFL